MPNASRLPVTINRLNRNRKYNSSMAFSQFRSSNNTAVDCTILSKFSVEIDLDVAKRVLSLKPKPEMYSNSMAAIFKILEIYMTS